MSTTFRRTFAGLIGLSLCFGCGESVSQNQSRVVSDTSSEEFKAAMKRQEEIERKRAEAEAKALRGRNEM
ncbi:hypothetical protein Pan216_56590 [Planctomycetes bacterium Pan216]|uniref:Uncharacterized protein n=1 Tax=Kolteria novifilia TaxID=2527975 RepID=A0A518BCS4_9BACT|nr:hypothetical protein Pan216_56590 [Planctomycetes bacterium Pan216]